MQQRAEQNKQFDILTKELVGIENQLTQKNTKAEEDKKSTPVVTAGEEGFGFKSADGKNAIALTGPVQAGYRTYGKTDAQNANTEELRRAYLTVSGKMYGDYDFKVSGDFAQQTNDSGLVTSVTSTTAVTAVKSNKTILDEAYFGINWWKQAKFKIGQFNMLFSLENTTSDLFNDFTERSLTEALTPSKERCAMIHGNPTDGIYYGLALSTGRGKNANNTDVQVDEPEVIGRGIVNLAKFAKLDRTVLHVGGSFSHGYILGNQATKSNTLSKNSFLAGQGNAASQTEGRGITFFTPTDLSVAAGNDIERIRLAAEAAVALGTVQLQSEYVTHNYSGDSTLPGYRGAFDKDINAWYLSENWLVTGESYVDNYLADGTWGRIKPKHNFNTDGTGIGAVVLGASYSEYDAGDFLTGVGAIEKVRNSGAYSTISTPTGAHAWTVAATWILNPNTRLAIDYIDTKFDGGYVAVKDNQAGTIGITNGEKALTFRGQFDF